MSKVEQKLLIAGGLITGLWGGGLLAVCLLRAHRDSPVMAGAPAPQAAVVSPNALIHSTPMAAPEVSVIVPSAVGLFAGIPSAPGSALIAGEWSDGQKREKLDAFWAGQDGNGNAERPHGRWEDRTGTIVAPVVIPASTAPVSPASTLVSVHIKNAATRKAMAMLSKQTGVHFGLDQSQYWQYQAFPKVSLDADNKPLLEVVNEFCCKTGLIPVSNKNTGMFPQSQGSVDSPRMLLTPADVNNAMGPWVVSGRFACEVQQIIHSATFSDTGPATQPLTILFGLENEPGVTLLSKLRSPRLIEAVDEKGNHLTAVGDVQPSRPGPSLLGMLFSAALRTPARGLDWAVNHQPVMLQLSCPADVGRTLARLRATEEVLIQTQAEKVETDVSPGVTPPARTVGGMTYLVVPSKTGSPQQIICQVTFNRGSRTPEEFGEFAAAVTDLRPVLLDNQGEQVENMQMYSSSVTDDAMTLQLSWYIQPEDPSDSTSGRAPAKLVFNIPTQWKLVDVPVEFDNLPLP